MRLEVNAVFQVQVDDGLITDKELQDAILQNLTIVLPLSQCHLYRFKSGGNPPEEVPAKFFSYGTTNVETLV